MAERHGNRPVDPEFLVIKEEYNHNYLKGRQQSPLILLITIMLIMIILIILNYRVANLGDDESNLSVSSRVRYQFTSHEWNLRHIGKR